MNLLRGLQISLDCLERRMIGKNRPKPSESSDYSFFPPFLM